MIEKLMDVLDGLVLGQESRRGKAAERAHRGHDVLDARFERGVALHHQREQLVAEAFLVQVNGVGRLISLVLDHRVDVVVEEDFEDLLRDETGRELLYVYESERNSIRVSGARDVLVLRN